MLYAVWTDFRTAEQNVAAEANALVNLYHLGSGLAPQDGEELRALARQYCDAVLHSEWREMDANVRPRETHEIIKQMWSILTGARIDAQTEQTAADHALSELDSLAGYRSMRLIEMAQEIPGILWFILLAGAGVTIGSSWMFGTENQKFQVFQVSMLTIVITVTLAAIADVNRPFQGSVHVSDYAFRRAEMSMNNN
jgi:hypothetical protein